jgi:anti-repressor protein
MNILDEILLPAANKQDFEWDFVQTIDARELHSYLEIAEGFWQWLRDAIEACGFVQDLDYTIVSKSNPNSALLEYRLGLDTVIQIVCIDRSPRGRAIHRHLCRFWMQDFADGD